MTRRDLGPFVKTNNSVKNDVHIFNDAPSHVSNCRSDFNKAPGQLRCLYTNVDALLNKKDELEARILRTKPDIVALTEIYPKNIRYEVEISELEIPGFNLFLPKKHRRGVAIYIKQNLKACESDIHCQDFEECVWCDLDTAAGKVLIGCIYRSPSSSMENDELLQQLIHRAADCKHNYIHVVILGDFNIPEVNWDSNSVTGSSKFAQTFIDLLDDSYLYQSITKPTRVRSGQQANVLDLLITDQESIVEFWELNAPIGKSDHLTLDFSLSVHPVTTKPSPRYAYFKGSYDEMRNYARENDIFCVPPNTDAISRCAAIVEAIMKVTEKFVPKFNSTIQRPQWMNHDTKEAIKRKHRAWNNFQKKRISE